MDNIIIYTDHFVHGVEELLENHQLEVGLHVHSSYEEVFKSIDTLPNLLGVVIIEYRPKKVIRRHFKNIARKLDQIAKAKEKPCVMAFVYKKEISNKIFQQTPSKHIFMTSTKFVRLTEETIRLDGISPVIFYGRGIFAKSREPQFQISDKQQERQHEKVLLHSLLRMIDTDLPQITLENLSLLDPNIRKIQSLRQNDSFWPELKEFYKGTYQIEVLETIRRERDKRNEKA